MEDHANASCEQVDAMNSTTYPDFDHSVGLFMYGVNILGNSMAKIRVVQFGADKKITSALDKIDGVRKKLNWRQRNHKLNE